MSRLSELAGSPDETIEEAAAAVMRDFEPRTKLETLSQTKSRDEEQSKLLNHIIFSDKTLAESDLITQSDAAVRIMSLVNEMEPDAEAFQKMESAILVSDLYDVSLQDAMMMTPTMVKNVFGEDLNARAANQKLKDTHWQIKLAGALAKGGMSVGSAVVGIPERVAGLINLLEFEDDDVLRARADASDKWLAEEDAKILADPNYTPRGGYYMRKAGSNDAERTKNIIDGYEDWQNKVLMNHPEWATEPPKDWFDLMENPDKLALALAETTPLLVAAGALTAIGRPDVGMALMYATEGNEARLVAKEDGATRKQQEAAYHLYGSVASVLENAQLQGITKLGKGSWQKVFNRTAQKVAKESGEAGKKANFVFTKTVIMESFKEAVEEASQGTWQESVAKIVHDKDIEGGFWDFVDRRAQEGTIGFTMGLIPGTPGAISEVGRVRYTESQAKLKDATDKAIKQVKAEIAAGLHTQLLEDATPAEPTVMIPTGDKGLESLTDAQIDELEKTMPELTPERRASLKAQRDVEGLEAKQEGLAEGEVEATEEEIPAIPEAKRIISTEAFEAAKARIKERRGRLTTGIDPADLVDGVIIGGYLFESGVRKFADWSAGMIKEFGKDINDDLPKIWRDVTGAKDTEKVDDDFDDVFDFLEEDLPVAEKAKIQKAKPLSEVKKDSLQDVLNDEVFQIESEAADVRSRQVDVGLYFVPKKFKGEVRTAIENDPSLAFNVTFEKGKGTPFDTAVQEGFLQREGDATDKHLDISEFLERVSESKRSQGKIGGVSEVILDKMIKSGNPVSQIIATKYGMLVNGESIAKINAEITDIAENSGLPVEPFLVTTKRGIVGLTREESRAAGKEASAELRQAQAVGEKVGFKAGERASREKAKVEIQKLKAAQKLTDKRRKTAVELVKTFVPKEDQGKFVLRVAEAKTPRDLEKLTEAVEKGIVRAERRGAVKKLRSTIKSIKPQKMRPEFKKAVEPLINALKAGSEREDTKAKRADLAQLAQQVVDQTEEDSVEHVQAAQMVASLSVKSEVKIDIKELPLEEVQKLTEFLQSMVFHNQTDTIAAAGEKAKIAQTQRKEVQLGTTKPSAASKTVAGKTLLKIKWLHDNLESMLDGVTGGRAGDYKIWAKGKSAFVKYVYDPINSGVDKQVVHSEIARDMLRRILVDNNVTNEEIMAWSARKGNKEAIKEKFGINVKPIGHTFKMEDHAGNSIDVEFTINEIMSIFMHTRNTHNLSTLQGHGVNRHEKNGEILEIKGFTSEKIDEITSKLTDKQKKVARQVGRLIMDGFNRGALNKASVELEGWELASIDNYWPAVRSRTRTLKGQAVKLAVSLLENMGFLKERTGTGTPLRLAGFFETVHDSNNNVAAYIGLAAPLRQVKAVYNEETILHLQRTGRGKEAKQITDFIQRLEQQAPQTTDLDRMFSHFLGNFAKSKLFLNAKIAPRQYLSLGLVKAYVDAKYFSAIRGKIDKALINEMSELSPQLGRARFEGLQFDRDVGDEMAKNDLSFYLTGKSSLIDKTAWGIGFFDTMAMLDVYRIAKAEVIDNNPDIDIKSDKGKALLKDRFEWLARHTQPMWHVKDRSLIGSNKNLFWKINTMFMSAREVIMRMNTAAVTDFMNSDKTVSDVLRASKVLSSVAGMTAMFTSYNFAWALLIQGKPKEPEELYEDFFNDIMTLPFFGDYLKWVVSGTYASFATGKVDFFESQLLPGPILGTAETMFDGITGIGKSANHFFNGDRYGRGTAHPGELKWKNELAVALDDIADSIATVSGLPYYGAKDIAKSINAQIKRVSNATE